MARTTESSTPNRETWLTSLAEAMAPKFAEVGHPLEVKVRLTLSLLPKKVIGRCYSEDSSADKTHEILIRVDQDEPMRVAGIVCHELVHAAVGLECGHRGAFKRCAKALGLTGKMTATQEGPEFEAWVQPILDQLGPFPHAALNTTKVRKQGTRLLKVECCDCGYTARVTRKWLDEVGAPICPCNLEQMVEA
jgi:hypothetical protein